MISRIGAEGETGGPPTLRLQKGHSKKMAEKRQHKRTRKRIKLRFGIHEPRRLAFSEEISVGGLFIRTTNVVMPGTTIFVELFASESVRILFEGRVIWGKKVLPNLMHFVRKSGMAIQITRFIEGEEMYLDLCGTDGGREALQAQ